MTVSMMILCTLGLFCVLSGAFVAGTMYTANRIKNKVIDVQEGAEVVIDILQERLAWSKDGRGFTGFSTRTEISRWLDEMRPEVVAEFQE